MQNPLRAMRHERLAAEETSTYMAGGAVSAVQSGGEHASAWLYIAGLCVTLSGLYAVNYALEEQSFAWTTYGLAVLGYAVSYMLRVRLVSFQAFQLPLIVCLSVVGLAVLTNDPGAGGFIPASALDDRFKTLQMIFVFMSIVHSFMLTSDAGVLFACVPCMTMLALVSTTSADPEVQNAFLVFVGASTFLLIHENFLRTRRAPILGGSRRGEGRLFGRQLRYDLAAGFPRLGEAGRLARGRRKIAVAQPAASALA